MDNPKRANRALQAVSRYASWKEGDIADDVVFEAVGDLLVDIRHLLDTLDVDVMGLPHDDMWTLLVGESQGYSRVNSHYEAEVNGDD